MTSAHDVRLGTHWEGCWRAHHECAISLLDKILREETVGPDRARRLLAEAKAKVCPCPCHKVVQPGLVPCPRCDGTDQP